MGYLFYQIRRLILWPYHFFFSADGFAGGMWRESERSRALLLGLPSVVFATVGIAVIMWAKFGLAGSLEDSYRVRAQKSGDEKQRIIDEFKEAQTLLASDGSADVEDPGESVSHEKDERFIKAINEEEAYWKKLRELNPDEPEYLYQLALISFRKKQYNRGVSQLNLIASLSEPGYTKAHLFLASLFLDAATDNKPKTADVRKRQLQLSNLHADQCLKREPSHLGAKSLKAKIFSLTRNFAESYIYYVELNKSDVRYFKNLVTINRRLGRETWNERVLTDAIPRIEAILLSDPLSDLDRVYAWRDLVYAHKMLSRYEEIAKRLLEEIQKETQSEKEILVKNYFKNFLGNVYLEWSVSLGVDDSTTETKRLELLSDAYQYGPTNRLVLKALTKMGDSQDASVAATAKGIYDPLKMSKVPAIVFDELGIQALSHARYSDAIVYFEKARETDDRGTGASKNPQILNNLAYSLLKIEPPNAARALGFIDEAMRNIGRNRTNDVFMSSIYDTRGRAKMILGQTAEAIADFEFALKGRAEENSRGIIDAIIECYDTLGLDSEAYKNRIKKLDEEMDSGKAEGAAEPAN